MGAPSMTSSSRHRRMKEGVLIRAVDSVIAPFVISQFWWGRRSVSAAALWNGIPVYDFVLNKHASTARDAYTVDLVI